MGSGHPQQQVRYHKGIEESLHEPICSNVLSISFVGFETQCLQSAHMQVTTLSMTGKPWMDQLTHGIRTKQTSCTLHELATGQQHFAWLAADPKRDQIFNSGMAQIDNVGRHPIPELTLLRHVMTCCDDCPSMIAVAQALVADYDWNQHQRILDIGGCYGSLLRRILSRHQQPVGLLFDQPHVSSLIWCGWHFAACP